MRRATVAALLSLSACNTTIIVQELDETGEPEPGTSSFGSWPEPADDTTGGVEDQTTGDRSESSSSGAGESTSTGVVDETTSAGDDSSSTSTGGRTTTSDDTSTGDDTSTSGLSTGDDSTTGPVGKGLGEVCTTDDECESAACIGSNFEDFNRCSTPCTLDTADDCLKQGHPGLCTYGGNYQNWCAGSFELETLELAAPYFQTNKVVLLTAPQAFLVPAQNAEFYVETGAINEPGLGPVVVDIFDSSGGLLGSFESGSNPVINPQGVKKWHWLIARPADGASKSHYSLYLKHTCWPNCP